MTSDFIHIFEPSSVPDNKMTILALHGTGGGERDLISVVKRIAPNAAILSPRGKVLENGMPRWFRRFSEGVFDVVDVVNRNKELAAFVQEASVEYKFDLQHLYAVGYSNGANMALALLIQRPELLGGAVLFRPNLVLDPPVTPNWVGKRILFSFGQSDPYRKEEESERLRQIGQSSHGIISTYWYRGGHELSDEDLAVAKLFLEKTIA